MLVPLLSFALQASTPDAELLGELRQLRGQVAGLEARLRQRDERLESMSQALRALADEAQTQRARATPTLAAPFLSGPPNGSDSVGVSKVAVFAPRLELDSPRSHDSVSLRLKRLEEGGSRVVAELELARDETGLALPVDQNGALYVLEWSTGEGYSLGLVLRDGLSGQAAATVQVKPLQKDGRFLFVGYRVD